MDARHTADALKARPVKTARASARALAEMLQTGWDTDVFVKSEKSHRRKALLLCREQLVKVKRQRILASFNRQRWSRVVPWRRRAR